MLQDEPNYSSSSSGSSGCSSRDSSKKEMKA